MAEQKMKLTREDAYALIQELTEEEKRILCRMLSDLRRDRDHAEADPEKNDD